MNDASESSPSGEPNVVLCLDSGVIDRVGPILHHVLVGLVDQSIAIRVISDDPRINSLALGPVRPILYEPMNLILGRSRFQRLSDALDNPSPTIFHAASFRSYKLAADLASDFDAQLVLQVSSLRDSDHLSRLSMERIDRVMVSSAPLLNVVVEQLKFPAQRVVLVRPGLPPRDEPACFTRTGDQSTLFCTSDFEKGSGVEVLIEAVDQLRKKFNVVVFLAGGGSQEESLRDLVRRRGLAASIIFAPALPDPTTALPGADIFVRPSNEPAFAYDVLEAMAMGVAVVSCADPVNDHLRHGETAHLVGRCAASDLAEGISALLENPAYARQLAGQSIAYVRKYHSMSEMADRTVRVYREVFSAIATYPIGN